MESVYIVDYDLPKNQPGRRQFYRYLHRILDNTNWKKSSDSVIMVDEHSKALSILQLVKVFNPVSVHVYKAVLLE
jgi:hypothetical protein